MILGEKEHLSIYKRIFAQDADKAEGIDVRIDLCDIAQEKRNQIEDELSKFLNLVKEILS